MIIAFEVNIETVTNDDTGEELGTDARSDMYTDAEGEIIQAIQDQLTALEVSAEHVDVAVTLTLDCGDPWVVDPTSLSSL